MKVYRFYEKHGKLPMKNDFNTFLGKQSRIGVWKEFGIHSWMDLMWTITLASTQEIKDYCVKYNKTHKNKKSWKGKEGLHLAKEMLLEYYENTGDVPTSANFMNIAGACRKGYWKEFGIPTWHDLLFELFGQNNERMSWKGKQGLDRAKIILKLYYKEHKKIPISTKVGGIKSACRNGYWKEWGVNSWHDLLYIVYGKSRRDDRQSWQGKKGLHHARMLIYNYLEKHQRIPNIEFQGSYIYRNCKEGEWEKFGINSWKDLLFTINTIKIKRSFQTTLDLKKIPKFAFFY